MSPMMMILFGGLQSTSQLTVAAHDVGNNQTLLLDDWIGYTMSSTSATALLGLRTRLVHLVHQLLAGAAHQGREGLEARTVSVVAELLLDSDCTGSSGGPLPAGWQV